MKQTEKTLMHVSLNVTDIEKTKNFYRILFNQAPDKEKSAYAKWVLDHPALVISFVEQAKDINIHYGHLGINVPNRSDINAYRERFRANDIALLEEEEVQCCYAKQSKFWVQDPDGHRWEIYAFEGDTDINDPQYQLVSHEKNTEKSMISCC